MPPTDTTPPRRSSKRPRPTFDVAPPSAEATGAGWVYRSTTAPAASFVEPVTVPVETMALAPAAVAHVDMREGVDAASEVATEPVVRDEAPASTGAPRPVAAPRVAAIIDRAWVGTTPAEAPSSSMRVGDMMGVMAGVLTAPLGIGAAMIAMPVCWLLDTRRGSSAAS